jgi:hypothetical protein
MKETPDTSRPSERPIGRIVEDILGHLGEIIRSELRLVQTELRQDLREVRSAGIYVAIAGVLGVFCLGFLLLGAVYALSLMLPAWLAAVSVGLFAGVIGLAVAALGWNRLKKAKLKPERTIQSMEDNVRWFKKRVK